MNLNNGRYKRIPSGTYKVSLSECELRISRKGYPMVYGCFDILEGKYTGSKILYYQVIHKTKGIVASIEFFKSMDLGLKIDFDNLTQYDQLAADCSESAKGKTFLLEYDKSHKAYPTYKIEGV